MRCDPICLFLFWFFLGFNPHTYMRCDCLCYSSFLWLFCFNPHTYMRCDFNVEYYEFQIKVSIHTPTWGVTLLSRVIRLVYQVSIHTPTWGVTHQHNHEFDNLEVSIHTPTWGVTIVIFPLIRLRMFQSTHLHEVWRNRHQSSSSNM